jgi:hypothetical protein
MAVRSLFLLAATIPAVVLSSGSVRAAPSPSVAEILKAASAYLAQYAQGLGAIAADEDYVQYETSLGKTNTPRRLSTQVVWLGIGDSVEDFRDVIAIDTKALRPGDDRLLGLFKAPTSASRSAAREMTDAAVRHYIQTNLHVLDEPMLALEFLRASNQSRSTFTLDGVKPVNGAQVAVLKFIETDTPRVVPTPGDTAAAGRFWIDAASGAVRQTELTFTARSFNFRATVKYASDAGTQRWLPVEMTQDCRVSGPGSSAINHMGANGGYDAHQELSARATYSSYRHVPVDLAKLQ